MSFILCALFGYLAGSCPTGFLVAKYVCGADIRSYGSGNIGATNVGRLMGKKWAVAVAIFDMLKGGLAVLVASCFVSSHALLALTGVCAVLGHNYPVWLGFKGGKGVATTFASWPSSTFHAVARDSRRPRMVRRHALHEVRLRRLARRSLRCGALHIRVGDAEAVLLRRALPRLPLVVASPLEHRPADEGDGVEGEVVKTSRRRGARRSAVRVGGA